MIAKSPRSREIVATILTLAHETVAQFNEITRDYGIVEALHGRAASVVRATVMIQLLGRDRSIAAVEDHAIELLTAADDAAACPKTRRAVHRAVRDVLAICRSVRDIDADDAVATFGRRTR